MTFTEALLKVPSDAVWSSSFGNACTESESVYYRTPDGNRWQIRREFYEWSFREVE